MNYYYYYKLQYNFTFLKINNRAQTMQFNCSLFVIIIQIKLI